MRYLVLQANECCVRPETRLIMSEVHVSVVVSSPLPMSHDVSLTAEPHDKLHPVTDLGGANRCGLQKAVSKAENGIHKNSMHATIILKMCTTLLLLWSIETPC